MVLHTRPFLIERLLQLMQGSAMVGRNVLVPDNTLTFDTETKSGGGAFDLAGSAAGVQVQVEEVVILSTCNRTEIYAIVPERENAADKALQLIDWMANYHHLSAAELRRCASTAERQN